MGNPLLPTEIPNLTAFLPSSKPLLNINLTNILPVTFHIRTKHHSQKHFVWPSSHWEFFYSVWGIIKKGFNRLKMDSGAWQHYLHTGRGAEQGSIKRVAHALVCSFCGASFWGQLDNLWSTQAFPVRHPFSVWESGVKGHSSFWSQDGVGWGKPAFKTVLMLNWAGIGRVWCLGTKHEETQGQYGVGKQSTIFR